MTNKISFFCAVAALFIFVSCNNNSTSTEDAATKDSATAAVNNTADWKIGVQLWTFRLFTQSEAIAKADSAGVRYIEAFLGQPFDKTSKDTFGISMSAAGRQKLKDVLKQHNIQMVAMGVTTPNGKDEWIKTFELAKEFGLSYITSEPIKTQWDLADSLAGVYGIKIAIHDHPKPNAYWHPDSVLAAVKGHNNIGSCADLGHWARNGLNLVDCLKKLEGHIYGVHLKDIVKFDKTDAADTVVGKGVIDFAPAFAELNRQNFKGMFSIEHESNWENNVPDVIETVKFYNDQVAKLKK
ncbi:sugar phosphate isomerase/epimerase family protein [Ferruginibacter paludis]|uniref:sugar phosphate isomerase/epimerase family protein n=1 Tax=Ferruginibacter paludis TaxID=1310417 RepID=UPI0025B4C80A|nr:sugar phosphate isomerase/epimerase family protein [Ferruginibacter paludis]MDN3655501.1 sugar phosphate isomerase/epimerase family protein [Ferruginibacter paludis]